MEEHSFIEALRDLANSPAARGLRDDAAVLETGGEALVLTHDMMVESVHFLPDQDMADVAWKLVAANLSDLAAKGAQPVGAMLGYMLGSDDDRFLVGLKDALQTYDMPLLGGDTVAGGPPRSFGLTAIGRATHQPVPARNGARANDTVWITGPVGAAMLGFEALRDGSGKHIEAKSTAYRRPRPRLSEGKALAPLVSAMMDISDGLLLDCWRLATASNVSLILDAAKIPVADSARFDECLRWGDDYELLFTLPMGAEPACPAHQVGHVEKAGPVPLWLDGQALPRSESLGYTHYRGRKP